MARLLVNLNAVFAKIEKDVAVRVKAVANVLKVEHKRDLGKPYPRASARGEYPAKRTGNLRDSVTAYPIGRVTWYVGYGSEAPYIVRLVDIHRKAIDATVDEVWGKLVRAAEGR